MTTNNIDHDYFWNDYLSLDTREYLSQRYFGITRCVLSLEQIDTICKNEILICQMPIAVRAKYLQVTGPRTGTFVITKPTNEFNVGTVVDVLKVIDTEHVKVAASGSATNETAIICTTSILEI
jgi:hypothetical protein